MITSIPELMRPWKLGGIKQPYPSMFGQISVVSIEPARQETHHEVIFLNQYFKPEDGFVVFEFDSGHDFDPELKYNFWRDMPLEIKGNVQRTDHTGYAEHTFSSGGENIYIIHIDDDGALRYPSSMVIGCNWLDSSNLLGPKGNRHQGVRITFQILQEGFEEITLEKAVQNMQSEINEMMDKIRELEGKL